MGHLCVVEIEMRSDKGTDTKSAGFTLIEIMVVVIIIAVVVTGVGFSLGATSRAKLKTSSWTMVAAARYAYSRAVTYGTTVRMVIDFEKRTVELQETRGRVVLTREDESGEGLKEENEEALAAEAEEGKSLLDNQMDAIGEGFGGAASPPTGGASSGGTSSVMGGGLGTLMGATANGESMQEGMLGLMEGITGGQLTDSYLKSVQQGLSGNPAGYRRPKFEPLPGSRGEPRMLAGDVTFKAVFTPHDTSVREEGKGYIYFFPRGITEHSIIQIKDGDDEELVYSIELHPLSGRAVIHLEAVEPEDALDALQEAEP
jgi:prepilin-type N-terminal cleavage/methylation domain-containing protein